MKILSKYLKVQEEGEKMFLAGVDSKKKSQKFNQEGIKNFSQNTKKVPAICIRSQRQSENSRAALWLA